MKKIIFILLSLLFYVPFFIMFGVFGQKYYSWDGLAGAFYMFYYDLIVVVALIQFNSFKKTKYRIVYYTIYAIFSISMLSHLKSLISSMTVPIQLLHPLGICLFLLPIIALFWFIFRKFRFFYLYLLIFISYPLYIIAMDEIDVYQFLKTCNETTPVAEYNPLYLPERFFHEEENGNKVLAPNVREIGNTNTVRFFKPENINKDYIFDPNIQSNTIFLYWNCLPKDEVWLDDYDKKRKKIMSDLIEKGNIILCEKLTYRENCPWFDNGSDTAKHLLKMSKNCLPTPQDVNRSTTIYQVDREMNLNPIAVFTSNYFVGNQQVRKYLIRREQVVCRYNNKPKAKFISHYREDEFQYKNYIKLRPKGE